jgi:hypothetical protein
MSEEPIELRLVVTGADDCPILLSNIAIVQNEHNEFILTFGQYSPPIVIGSEEERRRRLASMSALPVNVIARIGMTPDRMAEFIDALQKNYGRWRDRQSQQQGG